MKYFKPFSALVLMLLFVSCVSNDDAPPVNTGRTIEDVKEDFSNINFVTGVNDITLETLDNEFWNFRVIVPEEASATNKRPIVFSLHDNALDVSSFAHKETACLVEPGLAALDAFIVSPNSNGELWFSEDNQWQVVILFELMKEYLDVNIEESVVIGFGDGGNGAWFYADFYGNKFEAAIPLGSGHDTTDEDGNGVYTPTHLYVIHGADDTVVPVEETTVFIEISIAAGTEIEYEIADGLGHDDECDYDTYVQNAATWLVNDAWL